MATRTDQASTVVGAPAEAAPAYLELRALAIASAVDELVFGTDQLRWRRAMSRLGLVDHAARHVGHACSADVRVSRAVGFTATADVFDRFAGFLDAGGELRRRPFKSAEQAAAERVGGAVLVDGNRPRTAAAARAAADHLRFPGCAAGIDSVFRPLGIAVAISDDRAAVLARLVELQSADATVVEVLAARAAVLGSTLPAVPPQHSE